MSNTIISLKDIVVEFDGQRVLEGLNLDIHDKEFVTFLGPSGCGKQRRCVSSAALWIRKRETFSSRGNASTTCRRINAM